MQTPLPLPVIPNVFPEHALRVLVTTPIASKPGGVGQYLRVVRPHLRSNVQYFTVGSRCETERAARSVLRFLRDLWGFARTLQRNGTDLVHLNPSFSPKALFRDGLLLIIAKALRKSVVVFTHGWDHGCERVLLAHLPTLFRLIYGRADAFIVLASDFQRGLRLLGYQRPVFVQAAPIEDELLTDAQQRMAELPRAPGERFNILFLARIEKEKGIYEALEAYDILKQDHPFATLTVAGDGSERTRAVQFASARNLGEVSFIGHVEGSAKYRAFRDADAYLFPSYSEGLPLSVLEAMAYGLPIVTCAVGGLRDFFQAPLMGLLTKTREPQELASLLTRLIRDPELCSNISRFNRQYARDRFASTQVAAGLEGVYSSLVRSCSNRSSRSGGSLNLYSTKNAISAEHRLMVEQRSVKRESQ